MHEYYVIRPSRYVFPPSIVLFEAYRKLGWRSILLLIKYEASNVGETRLPLMCLPIV